MAPLDRTLAEQKLAALAAGAALGRELINGIPTDAVF
jgi:hypothetical protein